MTKSQTEVIAKHSVDVGLDSIGQKRASEQISRCKG